MEIRFDPPAEFLEATGEPTGQDHFFICFPSFAASMRNAQNYTEKYTLMIVSVILTTYDWWKEEPWYPWFIQRSCGEVVTDTIKNAIDWGNREDPSKMITVGIWFGSRGFVLAVRDEGDFYSRKDIKELTEAQIPFFPPNDGFEHGGNGMKFICSKTDGRFVDTDNNTVYLLLQIRQSEIEDRSS